MSTLGPRTALKSRKISGSLAYILAQTNVKQGTKAATNDVAGCTLEMGADGLWTGASVGTLTQVQADALVASGVLANVKTVTPATVNGQQVTWGGAGVGWVASQNKTIGAKILLLGDSIAAGAIGANSSLGISGLSTQRNTAISVGAKCGISYDDMRGSPKYLLCTVGGITSAGPEPQVGDIGSVVVDGTAQFIVQLDTGRNYLFGALWAMLALNGQSHELAGYVGAGGRDSGYVIDVANYLISDPTFSFDIVVWYGIWENDVSQFGTLAQSAAQFDRFKAFNDSLVSAGKKVIIMPPMPVAAWTTGLAKSCAAYYAESCAKYATDNSQSVVFDPLVGVSWESKVIGEEYTPDMSLTYLGSTSDTQAACDGVHPNYVKEYETASRFRGFLTQFSGNPRKFQFTEKTSTQVFPNIRNLGSSGGKEPAVTGSVASGLYVHVSGSTYTATAALVSRQPDAINGYWQQITVSDTGNSRLTVTASYTLAQLGLNIGDVLGKVMIEAQVSGLTNNVAEVNASMSFVSGTPINTYTDWQHGGILRQCLGQAIGTTSTDLIFSLIKHGTGAVITPGTVQVNIAVYIGSNRSGEPWSGILRLGRINIIKLKA